MYKVPLTLEVAAFLRIATLAGMTPVSYLPKAAMYNVCCVVLINSKNRCIGWIVRFWFDTPFSQ